MTFADSKARYEEALRKAQEARDAEKRRQEEAKARQVDWNGRAANVIQNLTNTANRLLGDLPARFDDAREGRGFIAQMRTLDDKKHAELKFTFVEDFAARQVSCKLDLQGDATEIVIPLPEMPASPQPSFDQAKREMDMRLSGLLARFFDRVVAASKG